MDLNNQHIYIKNRIKALIPQDLNIQDVKFEGYKIVLYCSNLREFKLKELSWIIRNISKSLHKRIIIRSTPSTREDPSKVENLIRKFKIKIDNVSFNHFEGKVIIETPFPEKIFKKNKDFFKVIREKTLWNPAIIRSSIKRSKTIELITSLYHKEQKLRANILEHFGNRIHRSRIFIDSHIRLTALGGYKEPARNCTLLSTNSSTILLDCGFDLYNHENSFPQFNLHNFILRNLDAILISDPYLENAGSIPFLYKHGYEGPCYMTEPTRNLLLILLLNFIQQREIKNQDLPFSKIDIKKFLMHTIILPWNRKINISPDFDLTFYKSNHILGSSLIFLAFNHYKYNILYANNYKIQKSLLYERIPKIIPPIDCLILGSMFSNINEDFSNKKKTIKLFKDIIVHTLNDKGSILIPISPIGNIFEILFNLEYFISSKIIGPIPIIIDSLVAEALTIYTSFYEFFGNFLKDKIFNQKLSPFNYKNLKIVSPNERDLENIITVPSVILVSDETLANGISLNFLKILANQTNNSLIFVSHQRIGTLGEQIQRGFKEFEYHNNLGLSHIVKIKMKIYSLFGFSGFSSRSQIPIFIKSLKTLPDKILTHRGEKNNCESLSRLINKIIGPHSISLNNGESIVLKAKNK